MRTALTTVALLVPIVAYAQAPAPGSGGGGGVGPSISKPTKPLGERPFGTPTAKMPQGRAKRDAAGQKVIGKTVTPETAIPGATAGRESGVKQ